MELGNSNVNVKGMVKDTIAHAQKHDVRTHTQALLHGYINCQVNFKWKAPMQACNNYDGIIIATVKN